MSAVPSSAALAMLAVLQQAVAEALDKKKRLGQYAVVWQDGRVVVLAPSELPSLPDSPSPNGPPAHA